MPVHKGYVKAVRAVLGILGIKWRASSPDLNAIKKVWRWIKAYINEMEDFPTTKEDLIRVVQELWDSLDPCAWILKEIKKTPQKLEAVRLARGYQTKY